MREGGAVCENHIAPLRHNVVAEAPALLGTPQLAFKPSEAKVDQRQIGEYPGAQAVIA
jgi:hypothetical protein